MSSDGLRGPPGAGVGLRFERLAGVLAVALLLVLATAVAGGAARAAVAADPPTSKGPPQIDGTPQVGRILRASRGVWSNEPTLYVYQWQRCDAAGATCSDVLGATDRIYVVRSTDVDATLRVEVTATNTSGSATATSAATPPVIVQAPGAPQASALPTVTGEVKIGSELTAVSGTWTGDQPMRVRIQWRRCDADGGSCDALSTTRPRYRLRLRDVDHAFRLLVRAENSAGTGAALSAPTAKVAGPTAAAPKNTSPPLIRGTAAQGKTLTASTGSWSGSAPIRFFFQWRRCDKNGEDCSNVSRASQQTYALAAADVGHTIRVRVTARNSAGSSSAVSDRSAVVTGPSAPVSRSLPEISGTARVGSVLTVSAGEWSGTQPISFGYRWLRCDARGGGCTSISRATARKRTLTAADAGHTLRVRVTATNSGGTSTVHSNPSPVVASRGTAPANRTPPTLSGTPVQSERLTLSTGSWTGTQPITYSFAWVRCGASLGDCRTISGATGNTYVLTRADVGHRLYGVVTARNSAGSGSSASNATRVVVGAPVNTSPPRITGRTAEGETLTAIPGTWAGVGPISFGYQWTRCDASGEFSSCVPIVVTSRPTYTLRAADVGRRIFVQIKAKNRFGASFVNSAQTPVVQAAAIGTVTLRTARSVVLYGQSVTLLGRAVGAPAGEPVTLVETPVAGGARVRSNVVVTGPAGTWTLVVRPTTQTTYRAQVRGQTSDLVTVRVWPKLRLTKRGPGKLLVRTYAARSFAGRTALVQRWNPRRGRWVTVLRVRLRTTRLGQRPTRVTAAAFRPKTPRGALVRVVLPGRQAGPGYLTGTSNRVRT